MRKLVLALAVLTLSTSANATTGTDWANWIGTGEGDISSGVLCKVNDVTVLTANADDCSKIGGEVTHTISATKAPAN